MTVTPIHGTGHIVDVTIRTQAFVTVAGFPPLTNATSGQQFFPRDVTITYTDRQFGLIKVEGQRVKKDGSPAERITDWALFWTAEDDDATTPDWLVRLVWAYAP